MICVVEQDGASSQLKFFIYMDKLKLAAYGTMFDIQKYFITSDLVFNPDDTDIYKSGWDYILTDSSVYLIIDTEHDFSNMSLPVFIYKDEMKSVNDLVSHVRRLIRMDKINKLIQT